MVELWAPINSIGPSGYERQISRCQPEVDRLAPLRRAHEWSPLRSLVGSVNAIREPLLRSAERAFVRVDP